MTRRASHPWRAYDPTNQLPGKRVLITGASRGIGESLAHAFAGAWATVALVARTQDTLQALAAALGGTAHPADLSDPTQAATLLQRVEDEAGAIDILVNNAGIESTAGFTDAPDDERRRVTGINYLAPAEPCRQAIPRMLHRGRGHIVNVSSMAGCAPPSPASSPTQPPKLRFPTSPRACGPTCGGCRSAPPSSNPGRSPPTCSPRPNTTNRRPRPSSAAIGSGC
jgi:NAD(P)-dependent dehydrogenase (short-subunit alcohol dehydrogenase family)